MEEEQISNGPAAEEDVPVTVMVEAQVVSITSTEGEVLAPVADEEQTLRAACTLDPDEVSGSLFEGVVDSGATHNFTYQLHLMHRYVRFQYPLKVVLASGK
jgi:hypothetical protein